MGSEKRKMKKPLSYKQLWDPFVVWRGQIHWGVDHPTKQDSDSDPSPFEVMKNQNQNQNNQVNVGSENLILNDLNISVRFIDNGEIDQAFLRGRHMMW